ncbi:Halomucin [Frankliniella fusca]|uniref:Halomucin n=1 Tax=Frankliniella fusca TaxID=407009 RepID=A0AAE1H7H2_9NEOP|nr:Halomucin [Frankliniella fusca]
MRVLQKGERRSGDDELNPPLDIEQSVNRSSHDSASEGERLSDDEVNPPLDIEREMVHFGGRDNRVEQERGEEEGDPREDEQNQDEDERESESENGSESEQESNAESSEEENFDVNDNEPLFEGAHITLKQSALSILSFALCHKLSQTCINDLLSLISLHCGPNNICLKSSHLFKKYFSMLKQDHVIRHYYCSLCEVSVPSKDSLCPSCSAHNQDENSDVDDPVNQTDTKNKIEYFIEFSISKQLKSLYKRPGFFESLQFKLNRVKRNVHNIEDIYDGHIYSELVQEGFLANPCNISFTMYFDGVSLFKSAKFSIWPLFLSINELKYKERTERGNIIIAGLWFGETKPNPNLFLKPIWDKMQVLQSQGIQCKLPNGQFITVKGRVVAAVGDLPAKALFMRLIQFKGLFSCFNCMSSGARFGVGPRNSVQVFPYSRNLRLRSCVEMLDFADQAVIARQTDPNAAIYGVKGPTLLSAFLPDLVRSMGIDDLHGIFSGLMKALLEFWFQGEGDFSISDLVDLVDERLSNIRPPFHYQRVPRSIKKEQGLFKGSDYKMMFFFFSIPVLYGILPAPYWEHHCKLVSAVSLLSQDSVSPEQIQTADSLLNMYVSDFQHLYGVRYLGLNVHQLLHLSTVVKNLGPLWVYSCFTYESLNGQLSSLVHGTRYAALQICASSFVCLNHSFMVDCMKDSAARRLCLKLMERGRKKG